MTRAPSLLLPRILALLSCSLGGLTSTQISRTLGVTEGHTRSVLNVMERRHLARPTDRRARPVLWAAMERRSDASLAGRLEEARVRLREAMDAHDANPTPETRRAYRAAHEAWKCAYQDYSAPELDGRVSA